MQSNNYVEAKRFVIKNKLALLLHPNKNRFRGAEDAFKRPAYGQQWKSLEVKLKKKEAKPQQKQQSTNTKKNSDASSTTSASEYAMKARERMKAEKLFSKRTTTGNLNFNFEAKPQQKQESRDNSQATNKRRKIDASSTTSASDYPEKAQERKKE
ncbi:unnamed protein product [Microthlaspi erraticum]|uniref:Uncharacterized protein n=1 Tax=Microthlaspi erraticum TaxID=1685480 RepID=A0A6D2I1Y6_9BRAS|nr:unnamed protein product [Microthlaspi erraticum]